MSLPELNIKWAQIRKGRSNNDAEQRLSLNHLKGFSDKGCYILQIEGSPDDLERLLPVWNYFWKSGICRKICGRRSKMVQMHNGSTAAGDQRTLQQLKH